MTARLTALLIAPAAALTLGLAAAPARADAPELSSWLLYTNGLTGYGGLPANVQRVRYSTGNVYINCSDIPYYTIGPWPTDPNVPTNQNFLFRIPRVPAPNTGTRTATPLGPVAVWINGVVAFNARDAMSYNNQNVWHQNAVYVEASSFDACLGHPAPGGVYHHHQNPRCIYAVSPSEHSRLIGYAFDGYPIYGAYAYANADGGGGIARMRTGYRLRSITQRHTLPDGTALAPAQYGPDVSVTYPLGYYIEDFEYVAGLGDLDACNGRFAVTPEYPLGTYAYYATIDGAGASAYPYAIGPTYYGVVANDNITSHGHVTVGEATTDYPAAAGVPGVTGAGVELAQNAPNPFTRSSTIAFRLAAPAHVTLRLYDLDGREVRVLLDEERPAGTHNVPLDANGLRSGLYFYELRAAGVLRTRKMLVAR
jgi:hypothetical protein